MGLFDKYADEIESYLARKQGEGNVSVFFNQGGSSWPLSKNRNLVLRQDTAIELGNPKDASTSFQIWRTEPDSVMNRRISLVGPDLSQIKSSQISFGKIIIVGGNDFNEENSYGRYRALELVRYDIHLKGYMMRGASQYQREWSRISKEAMDNGFSLGVLGGALIDKFLELDFVRSVEVVFITAGRQDVLEMKAVSDQVMKVIGAMNKMSSELSFDCQSCAYTDVCGDVAELRAMRNSRKKKAATHV
jgi:CO dehydrogenase/acetyl-CoA synthase beta subunit